MDSTFSLAVHALVYMNHKKCRLSSEALAENICTNPVRVRKVLGSLKKAGLVDTRGGSTGGYSFCGDASQLTLSRIAEVLDFRFVDSSWHSGDVDMDCMIASGMADIMDTIYAQLDEKCRDYLSNMTIADIDRKIFG